MSEPNAAECLTRQTQSTVNESNMFTYDIRCHKIEVDRKTRK